MEPVSPLRASSAPAVFLPLLVMLRMNLRTYLNLYIQVQSLPRRHSSRSLHCWLLIHVLQQSRAAARQALRQSKSDIKSEKARTATGSGHHQEFLRMQRIKTQYKMDLDAWKVKNALLMQKVMMTTEATAKAAAEVLYVLPIVIVDRPSSKRSRRLCHNHRNFDTVVLLQIQIQDFVLLHCNSIMPGKCST